MGILKSRLSLILLSFVGVSSIAYAEDNRILRRLEHGEVLSSKTGSSFFVQALIGVDPAKIQAAFTDYSKLPQIFPQIAFARPYKEKGSDRQFLYLKLRGLGDGTSVLMEVKNGGAEAFANAKELILSADYNPTRDTAAEVDTTSEPNQLQLKKDIQDATTDGESARVLGISSGIILEGPISPVMEFPNLRMTVNLGYSAYSQTPEAKPGVKAEAPIKKTYLVAKVSFGNQVAKGEIGDFRGFGERRLSLAETMGVNVFEALRGNLEK